MKRYCSLMLEVLRLGGFPAVALALVMLVNGAMAPLTIWLTQNVIDIGIRQSEQGQTLTPVIPWLVGLVLALVCLNLRELTEMVTMIRLKHRLRDRFNPRVLAKLSRLEYQCFEDTNTVDLISWVGAAPEEGLSQSFHSILLLPNYVVNLAGTALLLYGVAWWTLVGAACLFVPAVLIQMRMGVEGYRLSREQTLTRRKTDYISALITGRTSVKEVRLFQLSDHLQSKWSYLHRQVIDEQFALEARHVQEGHALSLVKIAFMIGSLIAFSIPLYYQKVTTGQFIALSSALSEVMTLAVWSIPYSLSMVKKDILYWNDFDKFMHLPEIPPETRWEHIDNLTRGISFNDVYFKYPNTTKEVLRGVSFRLRPGERVAIVGKNGAGKPTLIKLLLGLYQPDQGSITLDGVNVNLIHPRDRRRLMAAVFQDFTRYHLTLRENIGFGQIEKMKDDQAIWNAIHKGMADDVANSLSHGLDTYLGKIYVGGTDLSHGQWQRLAISRAWMSDAQIMILDEPASALDPVAEADLYEGFARLAVGKTWILVSHRLGSARLADRILVVDQGQIVEEGSHDQLMGLGGIYRQMYEAQAEWYIKDVSV